MVTLWFSIFHSYLTNENVTTVHMLYFEIESKQKQALTTILQTTIEQGSEFRHIIDEIKYTKDIPEQFEFIAHSYSANIWIPSFSIVS